MMQKRLLLRLLVVGFILLNVGLVFDAAGVPGAWISGIAGVVVLCFAVLAPRRSLDRLTRRSR